MHRLLLTAGILALVACGSSDSSGPDADVPGIDAAALGPVLVIDSARADETNASLTQSWACNFPGCRYDVTIKMTNHGTATATFKTSFSCVTEFGGYTIPDSKVNRLNAGDVGTLTTQIQAERRCTKLNGVLTYLGQDAGPVPPPVEFKIETY